MASGSLRPFGPENRLGGGEQCHSKLCVEGGSSVIVVLVPRAFQKYSTCMVYSEFLIPGKNSPLEGGGPNTYCKLEPIIVMSICPLFISWGPVSLIG